MLRFTFKTSGLQMHFMAEYKWGEFLLCLCLFEIGELKVRKFMLIYANMSPI